MQKIIIIILFALTWANGFAQQITLNQWQSLAKSDINLLPEYGNKPKTAEQILADKEFMELCIKQDGSVQAASKHLVGLGFSYLYKADLVTAMKRFNQAWLLDNSNVDCYWGFGDVYLYLGNLNDALLQYNKGLKLNPNHSQLLSNVGNVYYNMYTKGDKSRLNQAIIFLNRAVKSDPKNLGANYCLSYCYYITHDCSQAVKYYNIFKKRGGEDKDSSYAGALKRHCKMN